MPKDRFLDLHSYEGDALAKAGFREIPHLMDPDERTAFEKRWAQKDFQIVDGIITETLPAGTTQQILETMYETIEADDPTVTRLASILRRAPTS